MLVRKVQVVKVCGHPRDFAFVRPEQFENFRRVFLEQLRRKIRGHDFHDLGQLGKLRAEPRRPGANFQDAPAKFQARPAQERNEFREVFPHTAQPLSLTAEPGFKMACVLVNRQFAVVRQP
ncbi:MAG: hypothetical protein MUF81_01880 [Verrucomicrobia bacterium]|nr:hypothetical protein [Verrucomicrobiota bacterium]